MFSLAESARRWLTFHGKIFRLRKEFKTCVNSGNPVLSEQTTINLLSAGKQMKVIPLLPTMTKIYGPMYFLMGPEKEKRKKRECEENSF